MSATTHASETRIPPSTLGSRMRDARLWRKLEQTDLAEALGVSRATISNYENGVTTPGKLFINAWATRTDVDVEWLRDGTRPEMQKAPTPKGEGQMVHPPRLELGTHWLTVAETKQNAPRNRARRNTHPKGRAR